MATPSASDLLTFVRPVYHFLLAFLSALLYQHPSRRLTVVGVTGTKGKSSTLEFLNAIFEEAGMRTALLGTIREKIGDTTRPNLRRMSMPGRFALQRFLYRAVAADCHVALLEMTSEGARQYRHRFIDLDAFIFLNLSPEHIESHGSLEAYANAKFELGKQLQRSSKRPRYMVANADDPESGRYLTLKVEHILPFSLSAVEPWSAGEHGGMFQFNDIDIEVRLPGEFSLKNALAAATLAHAMGIPAETIARGIARVEKIPGRAEEIHEGQTFSVVVDYAHTPDSLRAIYRAYAARRKICVLGSTGGGRDLWKRPVMGGIADEECDHVILTNEDPYDEDPRSIVDMIARGMKREPEIIMDRREAIRKALSLARASDVVIITGKGTDPTIQGPRGTSIPWSDAEVAREEIRALLKTTPSTAFSPSRMTADTDTKDAHAAEKLLGSNVEVTLNTAVQPPDTALAGVLQGRVQNAHDPHTSFPAVYLGEATGSLARGRCIALVRQHDTPTLVVVPEGTGDMRAEDIAKRLGLTETETVTVAPANT